MIKTPRAVSWEGQSEVGGRPVTVRTTVRAGGLKARIHHEVTMKACVTQVGTDFWRASIKHNGECVFYAVGRTEQGARDALKDVAASMVSVALERPETIRLVTR